MKVSQISIRNFKGLQECDIDFRDGALVRPVTAILGDNGSGKTSTLQAIGLLLSMATRRTRAPEDFRWHGFLADRISTLGRTNVRIVVRFEEDEIRTTRNLFEQWQQSLPPAVRQEKKFIAPSEFEEVTLEYRDGKLTSPQGFKAVQQFSGRYYIASLAKSRPELREHFRKVGSVFWFDQMRNLGQSLSTVKDDENQPTYMESWQSGVEQLREFLIGWWAHHTSPEKRGRDYIPELKRALQLVFPGLGFAGVAPTSSEVGSVSDFYFLLENADKVFDISEMSSGEQAVFPLMYEFVRLDIAKSVVLIDELELHLHPPQQQALLGALPRLGPDCQFIITTHSPYLEGVIPDEHEHRLSGGRPCL